MSLISRCIQDIIKYWQECYWICGIAAIVVCIFGFSVRLCQMKSGVTIKSWKYFIFRVLIYVCDGIYLTYTFYVTFGMRLAGERQEIQWRVFRTVWSNTKEIPFLVENVLLFVPFGILAPLTCRSIFGGKVIAKSSIMISLLIEVLQYIFRCGKTEVDDVILNFLGAMIGYGIICMVERSLQIKKTG